jgi:uncharacterized protein (TIGR03382 family)
MVLVLWGGSARALGAGDHREVTIERCSAVDLPFNFCKRVSIAAYNVDYEEWDDPAAHSMRGPGQTLCEAADATNSRLWSLGAELHDELDALVARRDWDDAQDLADTLGRALHTLHDNCAHQGQSDPQHAWASRSDLCTDTEISPDASAEALECATRQTDVVMAIMASVIDANGVEGWLGEGSCPEAYGEGGAASQDPCGASVLPGPFSACSFLETAERWDGVDARWDVEATIGLFDASFRDGVVGAGFSSARACGLGAIDAPDLRPPTDVSNPAHCWQVQTLCLGSADAAWESSDVVDEVFGADAVAGPGLDSAAGCSAAGRGPGSAFLPALLVLAVVLRRSRP